MEKQESKSANGSNTLNSTLRIVFSLSHGVLLMFAVIFIFVLTGEYATPSVAWLLATVPTISYAIGLLLNAIIQYLACSTVNGSQLALNSLFAPGLVAVVLGLMWLIPSMESPVLSVLPDTLTAPYRKAVCQGFFVFWAGIYGQIIASGFMQSCPA